jgi:hypothetical protein
VVAVIVGSSSLNVLLASTNSSAASTKYGLITEVFTDMNFTGASAFVNENIPLMGEPFHDSISSMIISEGVNQSSGYMVEVCEHVSFTGSCMILGPGEYDIQTLEGLNDRISSMRFLSPQSLNLKNVGLGVIYNSS